MSLPGPAIDWVIEEEVDMSYYAIEMKWRRAAWKWSDCEKEGERMNIKRIIMFHQWNNLLSVLLTNPHSVYPLGRRRRLSSR